MLKLKTLPSLSLTYSIVAANDVQQGALHQHSAKSGYSFAIFGGKAGSTVEYCLSAHYVEGVVASGQTVRAGDTVYAKLDGSDVRPSSANGYVEVGYCVNSTGDDRGAGQSVVIRWVSQRES